MPILFGKHRVDRRQRDFRGRADGIGREAVSKEKAGNTKSLPTQVKVARQAKTAESAWLESQASRLCQLVRPRYTGVPVREMDFQLEFLRF